MSTTIRELPPLVRLLSPFELREDEVLLAHHPQFKIDQLRYFRDGAVIGSKEFVNEAFVNAG